MLHYQRFCIVVSAAILCGILFGGRPASTQTQIQAGHVVISEFRLRGPAGTEDEFVELYNNTDQPITVQATDGSNGWSVVVSNGQITGPVFTVQNGTVIAARGHLLGANSNGYSLSGYPSGIPTPTPVPASPFGGATPDRTWDFDAPDGSGVALFSTTNGTNFTAATRLDAAGFTSSPALYREGGGIPSVVTANTEHTYYRDLRGGLPRDTGDNASDFLLVGTATSIQISRLGAPGPENIPSPIVNNATIIPTLLDPAVSSTMPPNRVRTFGMEPNGTFGTLLIRRTITNNTGQAVSRLRFRVINMTTAGTPTSECAGGACADTRALTSQGGEVTVSGPTVVTVLGLRLEEPPTQPAGGGYNASLSADTITLATPLAPGVSINVEFKLGIERTGIFRFFVNTEVLYGSIPVLLDSSPVPGVGEPDSKKRRLIMQTAQPATAAPAAAKGRRGDNQ